MAPVWLAVIAVEYVGHRLFFARDLSRTPRRARRTEDVALPVVPLVVVGVMLVGFAALSPLGVAAGLGRAAAAAVVLSGYALARRRVDRSTVARSAQPVVRGVRALPGRGGGRADRHLPRGPGASLVPDGTGLGSLLVVALLATVLANLVNNLPATLLLVPLVAPLGVDRGAGRAGRARRRLEPDLHRLAGEPAVATHAGPPRRAAVGTRPSTRCRRWSRCRRWWSGVVVLWAWAPLVG